MKEEDFKQLIQRYVCPLLAGSVMTPESQPTANSHANELAALTGNGQTMHISYAKKNRV